MTSPYVTTLDSDRRDTDAATVLSPADQRAELLNHWLSLSPREAARYWRDASDDEREVIAAAERDAHALLLGRLSAHRAGSKHLGTVA